jgi:AraC-type DNA-binding domain-containing proteins
VVHPWRVHGTEHTAAAGGAEHVVFFHLLTEGSCEVRLLDSGEALDVVAGDLILIPQDDRHLMGSDVRLVPLQTEPLVVGDAASDSDFIQLRHGGGGELTRFVCGYLACSRGVCRPLLEALPRVLRIPVGGGSAATQLRELLQMGVRESFASRPGAESMLAKLSELMFVEAMRRYVESLPPGGSGWLAGVRDLQVGRALALLHGDPGKSWTVDELAHKVALSRSALAERFSALVGEPPMQYLMRWRLALAARPCARAATRSCALPNAADTSRKPRSAAAFKREFGTPPAAWRKAGAGQIAQPERSGATTR